MSTGWPRLLIVGSLFLLSDGRVSAQTVVNWTATSNGNWNTTANWTPGVPANSLTTNYANFNNATGVTVTTNLTQSVAGLNFGSSAGAYTLSKSSAGNVTLTLGGYGIKTASSNNQLISGTTLQLALGAASTFEVNGSGNLTLSPSGASDINLGAFNLTLGGTGSGSGSITTLLTGSGVLTKSGTATWTIASANGSAFTGSTVVIGGTLRLGNAAALGAAGRSVTLTSGTLELAANSTNAYNVTVNGDSTVTSNRATAGAGVTHTLGPLTIGAQNLTIAAGGNATSGTAAVTFGATTLTGNSTFTVQNGGSAATRLTLGALNDGGSARTLTKSGNGTLVLGTAATSLVNGTVFNVAGGTLQANNATALGSLATVNLSSGATFGIGANQTVAALAGSAGTVSVGSGFKLTIGNATNNLSSSFTGLIAGAGGITKAGSGTLTLTTANTYTGGTLLSAGTLEVGHDAALGTGTITLGAGTFTATGGPRTITNAVTANGNFTIGGTNDVTFTNTFSFGSGNRTFTIANSGVTTFAGVVSNAYYANTIKQGTGTLVLQGANTFSGPLKINAGIVNLQHSSAMGASAWGNTVANGAELQLQGGISVSQGDLTVQGSGTAGAGVINNISGANSLSAQLTFAGPTTIGASGGSLTLPGSLSLSNTLTTIGAGGLVFGGSIYGAGGIEFNGTGSATLSGTISTTGTMNLNGGGLVTFSGSGGNSNSGAITINNDSTLLLAKNASTNALQAVVTVNNGSLQLGASEQIPNWLDVVIGSPAGTFDLNGYNETIANVTFTGGSITTGAGTLTLSSAGGMVTANASPSTVTISGNLALAASSNTFAVDDGSSAIDLSLSAIVSGGSGNGLVKTGAGTMLLSGTNTYAGATTINGGILSVSADNNLGTAPGSPTINRLVLGGGTLLATNSFTLASNRGGSLTSSTTSNITASNGQTLTYGGIVTGAGNLVLGTPTTGGGTVVLSGASTYSGQTQLAAGTLEITSLGNVGSGSSSLGTPSSVASGTIRLGSGADPVALRYTGAGSTSDRVLDLSSTTGMVTLDASGAGALTLNGNVTATGIGAKTLRLTGSNAAANTLAGVIADNSASNTTAIVKEGAGRWVLSGANTFTGGVTVNAGTLVGAGTTNVGGFRAVGDTGAVIVPTLVTVAAGATLGLQSTDTTGPGASAAETNLTLSLNGTGDGGGGALQNLAGNNTWRGHLTLAGDTSIHNSASNTSVLWLGPNMAAAPTAFDLNDHTLTFGGTGNITISSPVGKSSGDTGSVTVDMDTVGSAVAYRGNRSYYTGATTINQGTLELATDNTINPNTGILGTLTIGDGSGAAESAVVRNFSDEQIADATSVTIKSDGLLDLGTYGRDETLSNLALQGGRVATGLGKLILTGDVAVSTAGTSAISGNVDLGGGTRTFNVDTPSTLQMTATLASGGLVKSGAGTMTIASDNSSGYSGVTTVANGMLALQHGAALGASGSGAPANGTVVASGATLRLDGVAVTNEHLTLSGSGFGGGGALVAATGSNAWAGPIVLGDSARIETTAGSLEITGGITGTGVSPVTPQVLTVAGAGNTSINAVHDGGGGGFVSVDKQGSGTLALNGASTFTGTLAVNGGTVNVTADNALGAQTNAVSVASGASLAFSGGSIATPYSNTISSLTGAGAVSIAASNALRVSNAAASVFDGQLSGSGLFEKLGAGTFTFSSVANTSAFVFSGTMQLSAGTLEFQGGSLANSLSIGTLQLAGGTLFLNASTINVGTLNITADTILDFGGGAASILNASNIYIAAGVTLTVQNWSSEVDFLLANSSFHQNDGSGSAAAFNVEGSAPQNQIHFQGGPHASDGSTTAWINYGYMGYTNYEVRPVPEPRAFGAVFLTLCAALLAWRRARRTAMLG